MPELPEVETVRTGLDRALSGARISKAELHRPDLRIPFPPDFIPTIEGQPIQAVSRRAKYLLWQLGKGQVILAHLGMTGRFTVQPQAQKPQKHDHMTLHLADGRQVVYHDPRRFGLITLTTTQKLPQHPLLCHLGPEPLDSGFNAKYLKKVLSKRSGAIKAALMDQRVVVGVGNIYASEALFLTSIHPQTPARQAARHAQKLVLAIQQVLQAAIASGGSSLRDFVSVAGDSGYFQHHFRVYDRAGQPCEACATPIQNIKIAGRSSFFCPACQIQS